MERVFELTLENLQKYHSWATIKEVNGKYDCYNYFGRLIYKQLENLQQVDFYLNEYITKPIGVKTF